MHHDAATYDDLFNHWAKEPDCTEAEARALALQDLIEDHAEAILSATIELDQVDVLAVVEDALGNLARRALDAAKERGTARELILRNDPLARHARARIEAEANQEA